jgi:hypothetical protein
MPTPAVNAAREALAGGSFNDPYGSVVFWTTTAHGTHYVNQSSSGWGVKSSGSFNAGYGPAWDVSVNRSTTASFGGSTDEERTTYREFDFEFSNDTGALNPYGKAFATEATMSISRFVRLIPDPTRKVANEDAAIIDSGTAQFLAFTVQFNDADESSFLPYAVTPGDLHSYTAENITKRMHDLNLFNGADYVKEVLEANAVSLTGTGSLSATTFSLSWDHGGGLSGTGVQLYSKDTFTEQGWSVDKSDYVGISGGENVSASVGVISVGAVSFQWQVMWGMDFSYSNSTGQESSVTWQVSVAGPGLLGETATPPTQPNPVLPGQTTNFDFVMYFLPGNGQWTNELCTGLRAQQQPLTADVLDPSTVVVGSAPWRITFVVTRIVEYVEGESNPLKTYPPGPFIANVATSDVSATGATITWTTDENADTMVQFGTDKSYGSTTPVDANQVASHAVQLTGLSSGTTYHFCVRSTTTLQATTSGDFAFSTLGSAP